MRLSPWKRRNDACVLVYTEWERSSACFTKSPIAIAFAMTKSSRRNTTKRNIALHSFQQLKSTQITQRSDERAPTAFESNKMNETRRTNWRKKKIVATPTTDAKEKITRKRKIIQLQIIIQINTVFVVRERRQGMSCAHPFSIDFKI